MHLWHQRWRKRRKKQNCILLCCQEERWFLVCKQHQCDFWNWVAACICIYRWWGDSNTQGKKEIRNNWKQLRLVEGKWVDRDEHFSMQPQKRNGIAPRDQTGEKRYEAVIWNSTLQEGLVYIYLSILCIIWPFPSPLLTVQWSRLLYKPLGMSSLPAAGQGTATQAGIKEDLEEKGNKKRFGRKER